MEIKRQIEKIKERISGDDSMFERFKDDPVGTVESALDIDLPDEEFKKVVEGVKETFSRENIKENIAEAKETIKKIF